MSDDWNESQLRAAVEAYVEMSRKEADGKSFVKSQIYKQLAERFNGQRTAKAFERRMQNISSVYALMGRQWVTGLLPAKNVGRNVTAEIERLIADVEGSKYLPVAAFEEEVKEIRQRISGKKTQPPKGNKELIAVTSPVTQFKRDAAVKAWVFENANGICECCNSASPFLSRDGTAYLEVHHVKQLANGGSDTVGNAVAICPNCHRNLHYGSDAKELVERLYVTVERLSRE